MLFKLYLNSNFALTLGYLNPALNNPALVFICRENPRRSGILLFADLPRFCRYVGKSPEVCPRSSRDAMFICDRATGAQRFRGLVRNEIHRRRPRQYKFEFSFSVGNDRLPSHKSGTRRENRNASDSPDCPRPSQTIGISTVSSFH